MPSVLGIIILLIFVIAAWVMIKRILPALLTLPLMALAVVAVAAVWTGDLSKHDILNGVLKEGSLRLHEAIITVFFGGILSFIMQKSGVAENMVKHGAELVGDNPFAVSLFSMGIVALLFTSLHGLGAVVMVAMVVLPMLSTVGIPPLVAGCVMLFGMSMGGVMNAQNWVLYTGATGASLFEVKEMAIIIFFLMAIAGSLFVSVELFRHGLIRSFRLTFAILGVIVAVGALVVYNLISGKNQAGAAGLLAEPTAVPLWLSVVRIGVGAFFGVIILLAIGSILRRLERWHQQVVVIRWYAYLIPVFPLVLILAFNLEPLPAFLCGLGYAILVTCRPGMVSMTVQSMLQGANAVLPAALLMVMIGILLNAVIGPAGWSAAHHGVTWPVTAAIRPLFEMIPTTRFSFIIFFTIAAPLALYRGPLNVWGLGFGVAAILAGPDMFPAAAVMGMLFAVGQIQGVGDPTNTQNVWLANELRVDAQGFMWKALLFVWPVAVAGIITAATLFMSNPGEGR